MNLRFVVKDLRASLPIKVRARRVINTPRNQPGLGFRFRTILNKEIVIVGVSAPVETNVGAVVTGAANGGIIVAKMSPALVEVGGVDESVLFAIESLTKIRIKEIATRMSRQRLSAKGRLLIDAQA